MSFPYCPDITCVDFVARLKADCGAAQKECDTKVVYPQEGGQTRTVIYMERSVNGKVLRKHFETVSNTEIVAPTVLRSVCEGLDVDPAKFGFKWVDDDPQA